VPADQSTISRVASSCGRPSWCASTVAASRRSVSGAESRSASALGELHQALLAEEPAGAVAGSVMPSE
jgi:hypothetical protein